MSQIGKKPIKLPDNVSVEVNDNLIVVSNGGKNLSCKNHSQIKISINDGYVILDRIDNEKKSKELHGLLRSLVNNMIIGVTDGFHEN